MKSIKLTFLLLIILAIFLFGLFFVNNTNSTETSSSQMFELEDNSIDEISIKAATESVLFQKVNDSWKMIEPKNYKINYDNILIIARKLEHLEALRLIEKNASDLSKYGLDNPTLTINFKFGNNEKTLLVGAETASSYQLYIMDASSRSVCTLSLTEVELFRKAKAAEFRDKTLLKVDCANLKEISLDINGKREMRVSEVSSGKWMFIEPSETKAKNDAIVEILQGIGRIKAKSFISDTNDDLELYNLDRPNFTLGIKDKNSLIQTIHFGKYDQDKNQIYIYLEKEEGIYTIDAQEFNPEDIQLGELFGEAPLSVNIDQIKRVTIQDRGKEYRFERNPENVETQFMYNNKIINSDDFTALYVDLMSLSSDGFDKVLKQLPSELKVIYEYIENNDKVVLELYKRDDTTYFMIVNEKPLPFYVFGQKVDLLRRWLDRVT